jgi:hypothetical protein
MAALEAANQPFHEVWMAGLKPGHGEKRGRSVDTGFDGAALAYSVETDLRRGRFCSSARSASSFDAM